MIQFYKTIDGATSPIEEPERGCWVNVVSPSVDERSWLERSLGIMPEFVQSSLDDDERSHVDYDDDTGQVLVILDCPFIEDDQEAEHPEIVQYDTHPLSLLFLPEQDMLVTVSLRENDALDAFEQGRVRHMNTNQRTRMLLQMLLRISQRYLAYLRNIDRQFNANERQLRQSMRNSELIKMLGFEKSLVYFSTSLKSMEATLTRISSGRFLRLYEDDRDLLDDVFIEIRQAMEMCTVLTGVLNGTMDTYASVINNNLNFTMRTLTIVTIVLSIPTMIFSFYGMNVGDLPLAVNWLFALFISIVVSAAVIVFFIRSRFFK
ncbi:MAG: magnesium transporter CorA family protein [Coriobacteriales bacterium]